MFLKASSVAQQVSPFGGTAEGNRRATKSVSQVVFWLYMFFLVDFFLHLSARIPGYGVVRPTLLLVLIITWALFAQRDRLKGRGKDPIFKSIFILIVYIVITVPFVEYPGSVVKNNLPDFVKAIVFLFFTGLIVDTSHRLKIFLVIFLGCQVVRVLEPLYLNITQDYWGSRTYVGGGNFAYRLSGAPSDVINPNELGFVIVTIIPFFHFLCLKSSRKLKVVYFTIMPCLLYSLILTMSRGAFVALLVIAVMVFKESSHKTFLIIVMATVFLASWSAMSPIQKDRYLSLVSDEASGSSTVQGRLDGIIGEFKLGLSRPIVGHGLGTTPEAKTHKLGRHQASHNMYGELLVEVGVIGACIFFIFIFRVYQRLARNRLVLQKVSGESGALVERLNKCLIALLLMYSVYSINYYGLSQHYWYFLGGLVIAYGRVIEGFEGINSSKKSSDRTQYRFGLYRKVT